MEPGLSLGSAGTARWRIFMNSTFSNCASFFGSVGTLRLGAEAALDVEEETLEKCLASSA